MVWTKTLLKSTLAASLAGGLLLFGGAATARADDDTCQRNVEKWESRLNRDIERHGNDSRQANHDRHELREAREKCERYHGDNYRDRYDNDRDYDRR
jgi:Ni/Co efflux regulator RcnB